MLRLELDNNLSLASRTGAGRGLDRTRLRNMAPTFQAVHGLLGEARARGQVPLSVDRLRADADWAAEHLASWKGRHDRLVLLGEPGAVLGLMGLASLGADVAIRTIDGPDPQVIRAAWEGSDAPLLVVLCGPDWVINLAQDVVPKRASVLVVTGDGTDAVPRGLLPGWKLEETAWAVDARFGRLSRMSLALAGWAGLDLRLLNEVARDQLLTCERAGMKDNPAYRMAAMAHAFEAELSLHGMLGLVPLASQRRWARGLCGLWSSMTARRGEGSDQLSSLGATISMAPGDESAAQGLLGGAERRWCWALWSEELRGDRPLRPGVSAWSMCRSLMEAQIQHIVEAGCPVIRLRLSRMEPEQLVAVDVLFLFAAMSLGALRGHDPLAMPAADRLRELHDGSIADNGG